VCEDPLTACDGFPKSGLPPFVFTCGFGFELEGLLPIPRTWLALGIISFLSSFLSSFSFGFVIRFICILRFGSSPGCRGALGRFDVEGAGSEVWRGEVCWGFRAVSRSRLVERVEVGIFRCSVSIPILDSGLANKTWKVEVLAFDLHPVKVPSLGCYGDSIRVCQRLSIKASAFDKLLNITHTSSKRKSSINYYSHACIALNRLAARAKLM
jgi:hypothetical protein